MTILEEYDRIMNSKGSAYAAIVAKGGHIGDSASVEDIASCVQSISTSGLENNIGRDVIFIDYDGTEICTYSKEEFQTLNALPPNPLHAGLVSQGWNWTLGQIQNQLLNVGGKVVVGQMYITESEATEVDCDILEECKNISLDFGLYGTATINWGDGATDVVTLDSTTKHINKQHIYAQGGQYTIKIIVPDGSDIGFADGGMIKNTYATSYPGNDTYKNMVKAVRTGKNVTRFNNNAFSGCRSMKTFTLPNALLQSSRVGTYLFRDCTSLQAMVMPVGMILPSHCFRECQSLKYASVPPTVTRFNEWCFYNCVALEEITIPSGVERIDSKAFTSCSYLRSVILPSSTSNIYSDAFLDCLALREVNIANADLASNVFKNCQSIDSVTLKCSAVPSSAFNNNYCMRRVALINTTTIWASAFSRCSSLSDIDFPEGITVINGYAFEACLCLTKLIIPSTVTTIGGSAFKGCKGMMEYHFLPNEPPALGDTGVFNGIRSDCIIYVPYSSDHSILTAYQTATNWSTYASYMQEEPQ